jgi:RNA polymerase sigma factor (sigma-70 family)
VKSDHRSDAQRSAGLPGPADAFNPADGSHSGDFYKSVLRLASAKAVRMGADPDTADDIAQEIATDQWARQLDGRRAWSPETPLASYLAGAASKRLRERRRKELRRRVPHAEYEQLRECKALATSDQHLQLVLGELFDDLEREFAAMSPERRVTFGAIRLEGRSYPQVAEERCVTEGTLRVLVHKVLQDLEAVRGYHMRDGRLGPGDIRPIDRHGGVHALHQRRPMDRHDGVAAFHQLASAAEPRPNRSVDARSATTPKPKWLTRLTVGVGPRVERLEADEIDWIVSADYCVSAHARGRSWTIRVSMARLERQLDPARFIRTHRSAIVNLYRVKEIRQSVRREHTILLHDGTTLRLSRSRLTLLEAVLRQRL